MLTFRNIEKADLCTIKEFLKTDSSKKYDSTLGIIYLWNSNNSNQICFHDGFFFTKVTFGGGVYFRFPLGSGDVFSALKNLHEYSLSQNIPLHFISVTDNEKALLSAFFGDKISFTPQRNWSDYVYDYALLMRLSGKKYHGQKNHINRFIRSYPDHSLKEYSPALRGAVDAFLEEYYTLQNKESRTFAEEKRVIKFMLDNYEYSGQRGAVLLVENKIIAITFGEIIGNTLFVHFEKALRKYAGSYSMINYLFANFNYSEELLFINREEDMGDEGLRRAKLALHPVEIKNKYSALLYL